MSLFDYFNFRKKSTASIAKERLQIIVSHERSQQNNPEFLNKLQQELIEVITKYIKVDKHQVKVELEHSGNHSILELNVVLPHVEKEIEVA